MSDRDLLKRLRDALAKAAGQYGQPTDEERNEWEALIEEVDGSAWFVRRVPLAQKAAQQAAALADTGDESA